MRFCWFYAVISDSLATITKSPENVLLLHGEDAVLKCSTDRPTADNPIEWRYDGDLAVTSPCTPHAVHYNTTAPTAADCNLIALAGTDREISGPYLCSDRTNPKAVATVISLSK